MAGMSRHGLQHGGTTAAIGGGHLDRVRRCTRTMGTDMSAMCWAILLWKKNWLSPTTGLGRGRHTFPWRVPSPVANFAETEPSAMLFTVCIMCAHQAPRARSAGGHNQRPGRRPDGPQWRHSSARRTPCVAPQHKTHVTHALCRYGGASPMWQGVWPPTRSSDIRHRQ